MARSVAWPMPVKASDPCRDALTPAVLKGAARKRSRNRAAATIGPIVWDEDGPMPTCLVPLAIGAPHIPEEKLFHNLPDAELLAERGRELYYEFWRRNDMLRFGQYTRGWEFKDEGSIGDETKRLYPIPINALLSNPNLEQNPGY